MSQFPPDRTYGQPSYPQAKRAGIPTWVKVLIVVLGGTGVLIVLICAGLIYLGAKSPEIQAVPGSQMRAADEATIRRLGLLDPDEKTLYFYSWGMFNIEEGMSFFTDRKVVTYAEGRAQPSIIIAYDQIVDITAEYNDSFFEDSIIWVELDDGSAVSLPVSSSGGGDRRFFDALMDRWKAATGR
jgi:hypothetical protein